MVKRGEIYWVDWGRGEENEQAGIRPALVIQNNIGNEVSPNTIIASLTTAPNKPYPFLVVFTAKESGLDKGGTVDLASIMTVSKTRLSEKCGELDALKMEEVAKALKISLELE